jgi:hypothetical protein
MRTRKERATDLTTMQQTVAEAQAQADAMQRKMEQHLRELGDAKAMIEEYWQPTHSSNNKTPIPHGTGGLF